MKEKNWLTWLTVLALVVGFAAMGASVWLSVQACQADPEKQSAGRPALPGQPDQEPGSFQRQKALGQIGER
ncbi:hypothetical protein [Lactobacillus delbrueckii]|uniref:hypothetical protein n=1 Tax=Lactobacillus delbrueckii TaxID=1584 RepID=UPI003A897BD4